MKLSQVLMVPSHINFVKPSITVNTVVIQLADDMSHMMPFCCLDIIAENSQQIIM